MTDQEIEKLQRGIEAALRDIHALNFGLTVVEGRGYDVTSDVLSPASDDEFHSFTVRSHTGAPA